MRADLRDVLALIALAHERGNDAPLADTPALRYACEQLFDLGYVNIVPPGHRYRLRPEGRAALLAPVSPIASRPALRRARYRSAA